MDNKVIEIVEEVTIGKVILEKGDKIEVLKEDYTRGIYPLADAIFHGNFEEACMAIVEVLNDRTVNYAIEQVKKQRGYQDIPM